jgi:pimeloyl-ACP methyl ester carboxylesterase
MRKWLKILVSIAMVLAVLAIILGNGKQPDPFPADSEAARRLQVGPFEVRSYDAEFVDVNRPTAANGEYPGDDVRRLSGTVWHPSEAGAGPFPLVVFSHGFSSSKDGGAYLSAHLASLGYVVVSANYPLTHMQAPGGPNAKDVVNQPADVSFLLDTLIAQGQDLGHRLHGMVDSQRIGVTGISLGGMTSTLLAYHPDMGDSRIGAALSIAGPTAIFNERFFLEPELPFLMLAGDIDALVPFDTNAAPVLEMVPGSQLVSIAGASHTGFSGPAAPLRWLSNPDWIGCYAVMQNIGNVDEEPWYELLGTPEQGINYDAENELCRMDPLPEAINTLRQQMITSIVVSSFFESQFAPTAAARAAAQRFLSQVLAVDVAEASYRSS